ncbi:hypothetical protein Tsubulata_001267 [Turnera subulata]|uniref:DUF4283 domain-containing protein n=1 Tax=Turnera subulata TaxID=218843 RepID=A0A9Q0FLD7_9ROSI|nr:hypothetical protein Tsubulata_001267 [Turnera subulata]
MLSDSFKHRLSKPWEQAVVVKLLGRAIGYKTLYSKIQSLWKRKGPFKIIDLEINYYLVRFWDLEDCHHALLDGPWNIYGNVLSVHPWSPEFRPSTGKINKEVTWIQLSGFPVQKYHSRILNALGSLVGSPVKLDSNSENPSRGKFAKIAVCVDLTKPLLGTVTLDGDEFLVVYEGLPQICGDCGKVGHNTPACPDRKSAGASGDPSNPASLGANHSHPEREGNSVATGNNSDKERKIWRVDECTQEIKKTSQETCRRSATPGGLSSFRRCKHGQSIRALE